jgi:hypothetical protein
MTSTRRLGIALCLMMVLSGVECRAQLTFNVLLRVLRIETASGGTGTVPNHRKTPSSWSGVRGHNSYKQV